MVFYGSSFEPAVVDQAMKREPAPPSTSPYGSYETVMDTLSEQLKRGPYLLGERLTAADILWGTALAWTTGFKIVPERPEYMAYIARITGRPSFAKVTAQDAAWAADFAKAAGRSA
jgi:glutathione S-transferase